MKCDERFILIVSVSVFSIDTPAGPAIPSLLNATGALNDGFDVWGAALVMDAQEASWTSK